MKPLLWASLWTWLAWWVLQIFPIGLDPFLVATVATAVTWPAEDRALALVACLGWWREAATALPLGTALSTYVLAFALLRYARAHLVWQGLRSWPWILLVVAAALIGESLMASRDLAWLSQREIWWTIAVHGAALLLVIPIWPRPGTSSHAALLPA